MMRPMRLAEFERRWVTTIAAALAPPAEAAACGLELGALDVAARYDEECARSPWYAALLMHASLWLTWLAPVWLTGRLRGFGSLDDAAQVALLERLLAHRRYTVRMAAMFLKLTLCTLLLGDTATLAQLGAYDLPRPLPRRRAS
jgi:hypothetical protein